MAGFIASMWGQAFSDEDSQTRRQKYHSCLGWLWDVESAKQLSKSQCVTILDWLVDEEETEEGKKQLNPIAAEEARLVLREALKEKGQMEML